MHSPIHMTCHHLSTLLLLVDIWEKTLFEHRRWASLNASHVVQSNTIFSHSHILLTCIRFEAMSCRHFMPNFSSMPKTLPTALMQAEKRDELSISVLQLIGKTSLQSANCPRVTENWFKNFWTNPTHKHTKSITSLFQRSSHTKARARWSWMSSKITSEIHIVQWCGYSSGDISTTSDSAEIYVLSFNFVWLGSALFGTGVSLVVSTFNSRDIEESRQL